MYTQLKRKIAFALSMGMVTTGIVSFALIALNVGFSQRFALAWLILWGVGYALAIPAILSFPKIRNLGLKSLRPTASRRHPLIVPVQSTDILKFEHRAQICRLNRS